MEQRRSTPWYGEGLRFQCTECGDCCTGAPGYVWVNNEEIQQLAHALRLEVEQFERRYVRAIGIRKSLKEFPNGDCVLFDNVTRRCQAYAARPRQCRSWPFWDSNLKSPETWYATCEICPGSGRGHTYTVEEIESIRGMIRV